MDVMSTMIKKINSFLNFKKALMISLAFCELSLFSGCTNSQNDLQYPRISSFLYQYQLENKLKSKDYEEALDLALKILENEPNSLEAQMNLAIIYDVLTRKDEAKTSFDYSQKNAEEKIKLNSHGLRMEKVFSLYFNLGVFYGSQKKYSEALSFYQRALDINPSSLEVKHNIELLIQQQQQQQQQQNQDGDSKDSDQQNKDQQDQKSKDGKDSKDSKDPKEDQKDKGKENGNDRKQTPKYQPRSFKGDKLSEGDVKKILGELSQQDKKIRNQYNQKNQQHQEAPNDKDW